MWLSKCSHDLQNRIKIREIDQNFTDLVEILKFLPRKTSLIQSIIKWVANQEIMFLNHICHPAYSERRVNKLKFMGQEQPPPGSVKFHWNTAPAIC